MVDSIQTNQTEYIYSDAVPIIPEVDFESLKKIEYKIKSYVSGNHNIGLTQNELESFLNWITFNARSYAIRSLPISKELAITSDPMTGQCAPTQNVNVQLLRKFGLDVRPFNTGSCIDATNIPISLEDTKRIKNGWLSTSTRHSVAVVTLPELTSDNKVQESDFVLDPTFRQFCLKANNQTDRFINGEWLSKGYVAPHPAYFMQENFCKRLIQKGYFRLDSETAKLYGDAFKHSSVRKEYQDQIAETTGNEYISYFKNIPMALSKDNADIKEFTQLPSEIIENQKSSPFNKLTNWFKKLIGSKSRLQKLPEATSSNETTEFLHNLKSSNYSNYNFLNNSINNEKKNIPDKDDLGR